MTKFPALYHVLTGNIGNILNLVQHIFQQHSNLIHDETFALYGNLSLTKCPVRYLYRNDDASRSKHVWTKTPFFIVGMPKINSKQLDQRRVNNLFIYLFYKIWAPQNLNRPSVCRLKAINWISSYRKTGFLLTIQFSLKMINFTHLHASLPKIVIFKSDQI